MWYVSINKKKIDFSILITNVILSTLFSNTLCWRENLLFFTLFCCISLVLWPWWWKEVFSFPIVDKLFASYVQKELHENTLYNICAQMCMSELRRKPILIRAKKPMLFCQRNILHKFETLKFIFCSRQCKKWSFTFRVK